MEASSGGVGRSFSLGRLITVPSVVELCVVPVLCRDKRRSQVRQSGSVFEAELGPKYFCVWFEKLMLATRLMG